MSTSMSDNGATPPPRSPQAIINQAIAENEGAARVCYLLILPFVAAGLFVLVWGPVMARGSFPWPVLWQAAFSGRP